MRSLSALLLCSTLCLGPSSVLADGPSSRLPQEPAEAPPACTLPEPLSSRVGWEDFGDQVLGESWERPVLVHFRSSDCNSCDRLAELFDERLDASPQAWRHVEADVDEHPEFRRIFGIGTLPTVIGFYRQMPRQSFVGALSSEQLTDWLGRLPSSER